MLTNKTGNDPERLKAIEDYVIERIDEAVENEWIKVYYQPVIRSLTGELCSAESLARWVDPEIGFLAPSYFIDALEKSKQIHKLDCFIVRKVCKDIRDRVSKGLPAVPVSVNFSRLDFLMCDMLDVVEQAVFDNDIPRDYLHIEVTESMIVTDADLMKREIERFRDCGYEVWMDDFGSGYSSLTLLKDYDFDMLKMDMNFLATFNDKSKAIMQHLITMAKDVQLKTLAEGVETKEQVEFLKSIGCGKLQGYYYSKPLPVDEVFKHLEKKGIKTEKRQWRSYYEIACSHVRSTEVPLEIIEDDGRDFKTLFMNSAYKIQAFGKDVDYTLEEIDKKIYHTQSPLTQKYRDFAERIKKSRNYETFYYTNNGSIMRFSAKEIAVNSGRHLIMGSLNNISMDSNVNAKNNIDGKIKELNHIFESVILMNPSANTVTPLLGGFRYLNTKEDESLDLKKGIDYISENVIFPPDKANYLSFMKFDDIKKRVKEGKKGYVENIFRLKQDDGSYKWKEIQLMIIPGTAGRELLYCIKSTADNADRVLNGTAEIFKRDNFGDIVPDKEEYAKLWENLIWYSSIKFFWKDKDRKYRGVSKSFLDFYNLKSLDDIVGKTDEDMRWHVEDDRFLNDELELLATGKPIINVFADQIVDGRVRNVIYRKLPLYDNGNIVGIMGAFMDVDEEGGDGNSYFRRGVDTLTGLMDTKSFLESLIDYAIKYNVDNRNYGVIVIKNNTQERIEKTLGTEFSNKVLQEMAEKILEVSGTTCAVSRTRDAVFALLAYKDSEEELHELEEQIKRNVNSISKVDGIDVTLRLVSAARSRSQEDTTGENIYLDTLIEAEAKH